jgi:hypothetical protein
MDLYAVTNVMIKINNNGMVLQVNVNALMGIQDILNVLLYLLNQIHQKFVKEEV